MLKRVTVLTIILSLVFLSVLGVIYFFVINNFDTEQKTGEIIVFLKEIEEEVGINFSEPEDIFFNWGINEEKEMIYVRGKKMSANNVVKEDREKMISLLQDKEFKKSNINLIESEEMKVIGYRKNNIACVLESNYKENVIENISLLCGEIEDVN